MLNVLEFSDRLKKIINYYNESSSSFAEKIGVQRSSISHIISGRNKPSLDFVMKVLNAYPEVELYWLLNGKGEFPKSDSKSLFDNPPVLDKPKQMPTQKEVVPLSLKNEQDGDIEKIVIFYKNGTFKSYNP